MKKIAQSMLLILIFNSCSKVDSWLPKYATIHYVDSSGKDLFGNGQNGYIKDSVRIYYFKNAVKTLFVAPVNGVFSDILSSTLVVNDDASEDVVNQYTIKIIHLKLGIDDTLKIHLTGGQVHGSFYDGTWYNGVQYPTSNNSDTLTVRK